MRYFKLSDDVHIPGRWELGAPLDEQGKKIGIWLFRRGEPVSVSGAIRIPLFHTGNPLDFSVAGAAVPIIHEKVATVLRQWAPNDVHLIPVKVESQPDSYFALNALRMPRCIDDASCEEVQYWTAEDGQPDIVGEYRAVAGLRIDPTKVSDARVFRPWGWPVVLIVSENIKTALEAISVTGAKFSDVTSPVLIKG